MSKEAMTLALEALKGALDHGDFRNFVTDPTGTIDEGVVRAIDVIQPAIKALEEALKQEQGEPDYWLGYGLQAHTEKPFEDATPLYTTPQPAQKPLVGLTDEEMRELEKQFEAERVRTPDEEYLIIYPAAYWNWQQAIEANSRRRTHDQRSNEAGA